MPGVAGIIGLESSSNSLGVLNQMVETMVHESFYSSGAQKICDGFWAGWACLAGSFADCMPVWNESHDIALIFAGETFAEAGEQQVLRASGHQVLSSDASALVHMYEERGLAFLKELNGTFAGAIADLRDGSVTIFNDRFGLGRIYYHDAGDRMFFASEAKSIIRVVPSTRSLDMRGLGEYLVCGCALQDRTLFSRISTLPPASAWIFRRGERVRKTRYFDPGDWDGQPALDTGAYYEELRETFPRILAKYFGGSQRVIMSLTGGLDSRLIMAGRAAQPGSLPCYGVRGMYRECEDVRIGRTVAEVCQQPHTTITVDGGFFAAFPDLAMRTAWLSDGALDTIGSAGLYANQMARALGPVRMTGNYGGEVLRGIVSLRAGPPPVAVFGAALHPFFDAAAETCKEERKVSRTAFILFKQVPWYHYARFALDSAQMTVRSPYLDNELVRLAFRAPRDATTCKEVFIRLIGDLNPRLGLLPTDRGAIHRPRVVPVAAWNWWKEFLPRAEYVFDYGMPKWLARLDSGLAFAHLDRIFLGIQKYCHFRRWYRYELAGFVKEVLLDRCTLSRPYLCGQELERRVMEHVSGRGNWTLDIHRHLTLEFIERRLLRQT